MTGTIDFGDAGGCSDGSAVEVAGTTSGHVRLDVMSTSIRIPGTR